MKKSKNLFEFEFKDLTKGNEATAKFINIQFNTGAFYVLIKELNSIYEGDILLPKFNLTCTKVITAHDKEDNYVHRKIELSFKCLGKNCCHKVLIHIYNTQQKLLIQGGNDHNYASSPYLYVRDIFQPYIEDLS